jgi:hypothetical protein
MQKKRNTKEAQVNKYMSPLEKMINLIDIQIKAYGPCKD